MHVLHVQIWKHVLSLAMDVLKVLKECQKVNWNCIASKTCEYDTPKHVHYICSSIHNKIQLYHIIQGFLKLPDNYIYLILSPLKPIDEGMHPNRCIIALIFLNYILILAFIIFNITSIIRYESICWWLYITNKVWHECDPFNFEI